MLQFLFRDEVEIELLGKVLPQETVGILIRPTFPRMIRVCEVHHHACLLLDPLPIAELNTVVERERPAFLFRYTLELFDRELHEELRIHLRQKERNEETAPAIDERYDAYPFVSAHERVALPISDSSASLDDTWPLIDTPLLRLFTCLFPDLRTASPAILSLGGSQELFQVRCTLIEVAVYRTCNDRSFSSSEYAGDLLRRLVLLELCGDESQQRSADHADALHRGDARHALLSAYLPCIVSVSFPMRPHVSAKRTLVFADGSRDLAE